LLTPQERSVIEQWIPEPIPEAAQSEAEEGSTRLDLHWDNTLPPLTSIPEIYCQHPIASNPEFPLLYRSKQSHSFESPLSPPGSDRGDELGNTENTNSCTTKAWMDDSSLDAEHEIIRGWRQSATVKFEAGQYEEAEELLEKVVNRSEVRYGPAFEGRDKITKLLTKIYDKLGKWAKLERILQEGIQALEDHQLLHTLYLLGEACLGKGDLDKAEEWCQYAYRGRKVLLGEHHIQYYQSLDLLARIYEAGGPSKRFEVEGYRALIPPGVQTGTIPWESD